MQELKRPKRSDLATTVAGLHGVSDRYVRMVINGERENEAILETYMRMIEGKTLLIQSIKKLLDDQVKAKSENEADRK